MTLNPGQWAAAVFAAVMIGLSKTAISGLSALNVALLAYVFPSSKQATGFILPMLVFADCFAVYSYRRHTQWRFLWKLFPWTALGVVAGFIALSRISDRATRGLIGVIILSLAAVSYWRRRAAAGRSGETGDDPAPLHWTVGIFVGVLTGFVTLVANAAGPLMAVYLLAMRLPKMEYVGTAAVFFLLLNLFKIPFMAALGLVTLDSFKFNVLLLPAVLFGAVAGRWLLVRVNQSLFERMVLGLSAVAGVLLIV